MKIINKSIIAGALLAISSLSAQTTTSLFNFEFGGNNLGNATLSTVGTTSGITVGSIFDNLPTSIGANANVDGFIDDGTIAFSRSRVFIDRGGSALGFNGTGTPVSSFTITAGAGFDVTLTRYSLQGVVSDGAFSTNGLRFGLGVNGTIATEFANFQSGTREFDFNTPIVITAGTTQTIDVFMNSASGTTQHILDNLNIQGFTTAAVPEPSTYAVIFGGLVLVFAMVRRRMK